MLREMFAKKMLDEKLDFLGFEDSYKLFLSDEKVENTKFSWVYNSEELGDICLRYGNTLDEVKKEMIEVHGYEEFVVGNGYDEFKEFTVKVCPAVTYTDLIK